MKLSSPKRSCDLVKADVDNTQKPLFEVAEKLFGNGSTSYAHRMCLLGNLVAKYHKERRRWVGGLGFQTD